MTNMPPVLTCGAPGSGKATLLSHLAGAGPFVPATDTQTLVTGAAKADLALVVIDAAEGIRPETRRHAYLAQLLGLKHIVLVITKMDLVDYAQARFEAILSDSDALAMELGIEKIAAIPVSGLEGDNIAKLSTSARSARGTGPRGSAAGSRRVAG